jgi:hypothetical protein
MASARLSVPASSSLRAAPLGRPAFSSSPGVLRCEYVQAGAYATGDTALPKLFPGMTCPPTPHPPPLPAFSIPHRPSFSPFACSRRPAHLIPHVAKPRGPVPAPDAATPSTTHVMPASPGTVGDVQGDMLAPSIANNNWVCSLAHARSYVPLLPLLPASRCACWHMIQYHFQYTRITQFSPYLIQHYRGSRACMRVLHHQPTFPSRPSPPLWLAGEGGHCSSGRCRRRPRHWLPSSQGGGLHSPHGLRDLVWQPFLVGGCSVAGWDDVWVQEAGRGGWVGWGGVGRVVEGCGTVALN